MDSVVVDVSAVTRSRAGATRQRVLSNSSTDGVLRVCDAKRQLQVATGAPVQFQRLCLRGKLAGLCDSEDAAAAVRRRGGLLELHLEVRGGLRGGGPPDTAWETDVEKMREMLESGEDRFGPTVFCRWITGETLELRVDEDWTVLQLKLALFHMTGSHLAPRRLIFAGKQLMPDMPLSVYGISGPRGEHAVYAVKPGILEVIPDGYRARRVLVGVWARQRERTRSQAKSMEPAAGSALHAVWSGAPRALVYEVMQQLRRPQTPPSDGLQ